MHPYFTTPPRTGRRGLHPRSVADRFWEKVDTSGECWIWTGSRDLNGYGDISVGRCSDGKHRLTKAHRVSYVMHVGEIPEGLFVLHNCPGGDNPSCVNPAHLWLGTKKDNAMDCVAKGGDAARTHPEKVCRGETSGCSKLTDSKVREIRRLYGEGNISQQGLADRFGVKQATIWGIVNCKAWRHV